jgi:tetratricopeptide (TPR) repeat protein
VEAQRPLTVVVVNPVSMLEFAPGGSANVAAFYRRDADHDYIVMGSNTFGGSDFEVVLHEYQHLITHANFPVVPRWVDEGLAEFYSTFEEADGGRRYKIGEPVSYHLTTLNRSGLYPLLPFLEDDGRSMKIDDRSRVNVYYAQSWALIHFFMLGDGGKWTKTFGPFVDALVAGEPVDTAFRRTVSPDVNEFESRFKAYVAGRRFNYMLFSVRSGAAEATSVQAGKLSQAETETLRAILSNDSKKAGAALLLALNADPGYRPALARKAAQLLEQRETARAADELAALAKTDGGDLGTCRLALHASNLAGRFAETLKMCPDLRGSVSIAFDRAVALENLGRLEEALRQYEAIQRAPADAFAEIRGQEWRYLEEGRYLAAARAADVRLARRADDADGAAYLSLVRTASLCMEGKCEEARAALRTASLPSGASDWVQQLFRYHLADIDDATLLKGARTKEQETEARTYVALNLLAQHRTSDALPHLKWVAERGAPGVLEYSVALGHLTRVNKP